MIKKLYTYIGKYKKLLFLIPLIVLLEVLCELSMPILMAKVIDNGIPARDIAYISRIGALMITLALIAIGLGILNMRFNSNVSMGFGANLRNALFEKIQEFSFLNIDNFSTASLITRLTNDVNNIQMTFMMMLRMMLRAPMMFLVAFFMAFSINRELSIILALAIPLLAIGIVVIMKMAMSRFSIVQESIDQLNNTLQENLIGIRVVKSFVRNDHEIGKFKSANDNLTRALIRAISLAIMNMPLMMLVLNSAILAIIWIGGNMVAGGTLGAGELVSYISYVMTILMSVILLSMVFLMSARAAASGKRIIEVLEHEIDIKNPDRPVISESASAATKRKLGKVEFRNVKFKYHAEDIGENVLSDISFTANPGQVIGVVGGTGTGKSTLVHLIPRLYDVSEGQVLVDDLDVREYDLEKLRDKIGMVLQKNTLFTGTIRDNLRWGNPGATQEQIESACRDAQAHDFIMSFPEGYETQLGQGGVNVSGGQKQRLCIARAMLKKPDILILDDSTSAVDSTTESKIRKSFYQNLAATTVFIIAQRISSVRDADQIIIIDDGKIAGVGTHKRLLETNSIYKEIAASQQEGTLNHG